MIQLVRAPKPEKLTDELQQRLTQIFLETGESVWLRSIIKEELKSALLAISDNKCCYCECNVTEECKYMEVEHFHPKSLYPNEVMDWENLLPSCKRCNGQKGTHDTKAEPIIHPIENNPKDHLSMRAYRIYGKTDLGGKTIEVLDLNDRERLTFPRAKIGFALEERFENLLELVKDIDSGLKNSELSKKRAVNSMEKLLIEATPQKDYCATAAHVIVNSSVFAEIKEKTRKLGLWNSKLDKLEKIAGKFAFEEKPSPQIT